MTIGMISKRYAKALLGYAQEQKSEDIIYAEMKRLASVFVAEPRLRMAMDNPILTTKDKLNLLKSAVGEPCSPVFIRFIELVLKNRREVYLHTMAFSYQNLYCITKHINTARLITASVPDNAVIEKMKTLLQKIKPGSLELETSVDPSIDGGFILFVDTYRLDASVKSQLQRIKQQFIVENSKMRSDVAI